jgi:hypothetical protein
VRACGAARERKQRDVAGALDGFAEPALVARAHAGHAARKNLAALLHKLREDVGTLVVDEVHLLDAELADFLFSEVLALAAARAPWTAAGTSWAAFTAWSAVSAAGASVTTAWTVTAAAWTAGAGWLSLFVCHNCLPFGMLLSIVCSSGPRPDSPRRLTSGPFEVQGELKPRPPEENI